MYNNILTGIIAVVIITLLLILITEVKCSSIQRDSTLIYIDECVYSLNEADSVKNNVEYTRGQISVLEIVAMLFMSAVVSIPILLFMAIKITEYILKHKGYKL